MPLSYFFFILITQRPNTRIRLTPPCSWVALWDSCHPPWELSGCQDYIWSPGETESDWLSGEDQPMKRSLLSLVGDFVDSSCSHRKTLTVLGCQWSEMQKMYVINVTAAVAQWKSNRPVSRRSWVRSLTASYQRHYTNGRDASLLSNQHKGIGLASLPSKLIKNVMDTIWNEQLRMINISWDNLLCNWP